METSLEHIKHLHAQLNMNSLQIGKGPSWKKKVSIVVVCMIILTMRADSLLARNAKNEMMNERREGAFVRESSVFKRMHKLNTSVEIDWRHPNCVE